MERMLNVGMLETMSARFAVLAVGRYALPVRFRIRGQAVDCRIPTWSGMGDLLGDPEEAMLVACAEELCRQWWFIRGPVSLITDPDWEEFQPQPGERLALADLYQILRIEPKRIEIVDEQRCWGYRETADR